jgi:hypothetical protein
VDLISKCSGFHTSSMAHAYATRLVEVCPGVSRVKSVFKRAGPKHETSTLYVYYASRPRHLPLPMQGPANAPVVSRRHQISGSLLPDPHQPRCRIQAGRLSIPLIRAHRPRVLT